jgi:hypothetical protein
MDKEKKDDVDEAFQAFIQSFGRNAQKREDAWNALIAAKFRYAEGDKRRKQEIDEYVNKRRDNYLDP